MINSFVGIRKTIRNNHGAKDCNNLRPLHKGMVGQYYQSTYVEKLLGLKKNKK